MANFAIVAAIYKFFTKETLDIKAYGKIRINRMRNNIQDLTNLISRDFHDGKTFSRDSLLKAFYKDVQLDYIERYPTPPQEKRIKLSANGKSLSVKRDSVRDVSQLMSMTKCLLNDGWELDNTILNT